MANEPVAFAAILAGGWLLDRGVNDLKTAFTTSSAGGPTGAGAGGPTGTAAGTNPFSQAHGLTIGRTDQGVDATMTPGSPILSPWNAKLVNIAPNWYSGQPQMVFEILGGPLDGKFFYLAEQVAPAIAVGTVVNAGQVIAHYASSGTGIEMGWAANSSGQTLAQATTGYTEGQVTAAGQSFRAELAKLGVNV